MRAESAFFLHIPLRLQHYFNIISSENDRKTRLNSFKRRNQIEADKLQVEISQLGIDDYRYTIQTEILSKYIDILYAKESIDIAEKSLEVSAYQLERAKALVASGKMSRVDCAQTEDAIAEIKTVLNRNHKIKDSDSEDYNVRSQQELSEMMSSTNEMMTILLACVAGISLLVGGIGIMNIMLVSVTERTREIGLRMSIGARGIDILAQFLIESIIISVTGGIIGVIFGAAASFCVKILLNWPVSIQIFSVILSFVVCSVTGIFFGWYPAKKAANLDPIEALRYE
ncbi:MAG: FtsX-like permease family protein [Bacteroidales bacterium]|nr:FtsX-like permease family protein [Bacteroidales bacterium]MDD6668509.1 FtsX-like permease family protein [Bacteroidales bacterium]